MVSRDDASSQQRWWQGVFGAVVWLRPVSLDIGPSSAAAVAAAAATAETLSPRNDASRRRGDDRPRTSFGSNVVVAARYLTSRLAQDTTARRARHAPEEERLGERAVARRASVRHRRRWDDDDNTHTTPNPTETRRRAWSKSSFSDSSSAPTRSSSAKPFGFSSGT